MKCLALVGKASVRMTAVQLFNLSIKIKSKFVDGVRVILGREL